MNSPVLKQLFAFIRKEFYHVFRDRKTLLMLFGVPIAQVFLFGFVLSNEIKNSKIVVCDYAKDYGSQEIIRKIEASKYFKVQESNANPRSDRSCPEGRRYKNGGYFPRSLL